MRRLWTTIAAPPRTFARRLRPALARVAEVPRSVIALVKRESRSLRQGFFANLASSIGDLAAGLALGTATGRLEEIPGLLLLVPPAIGMRGNIFAAMGSRLGTAVHLGEFSVSMRRGSVLGDNVAAATVNTLVLSAVMAPMARVASVAFGIPSVSTLDFAVVSLLGGVISSLVVMVVTVIVAVTGARRRWDVDYVVPPIATVTGDIVTLPSLLLASELVGIEYVTPIAALAFLLGAAVVVARELAVASPRAKRIVAESIPILIVAAGVDTVAGITLEKRLETFLVFPVFLVMLPAFLEDSGNLGIMFSARLSSRLHTGILRPRILPTEGLAEIVLILLLSFPVYLALGLTTSLVAVVFGLATPGWLPVLAVCLIAGAATVLCAVFVGYYAAIAAFRLDLDPDNHGAPLVTSSMDVAASTSLVVVLTLMGYIPH